MGTDKDEYEREQSKYGKALMKTRHYAPLLAVATLVGTVAVAQPVLPIRAEVIINRVAAPWESQQVQEPCILPNPKDSTRLVMFYSGVPTANRNVCYIGKAWAQKEDPYTWHQDESNPVFSPSSHGWDSGSIRLDAVLYIPEEDAYYIYYSGTRETIQDRIGLAICPAGNDGYTAITPATIRRVGTAPVLGPETAEPFAETMASQAAVWRERDEEAKEWKWYMYYSYRGKNGTLPGIRLATSTDGRTWHRRFNRRDPGGMGHVFASTPNAYYEWHQVFRRNGTYVLSIEVGIERGKRWRPVIAVSQYPDHGWVQLDVDAVLQTKWEGCYSDTTIFHVATPAFYEINGKWYLFTQACPLPANGNYIDGHWDLWCFSCDREMSTLPGRTGLFVPGAPKRIGDGPGR